MMVSSVNAPPGDTPVSAGQAQIYTSPNGTCLGIEYKFLSQTTDLLCIAVRDFEILVAGQARRILFLSEDGTQHFWRWVGSTLPRQRAVN